MSAASNVGLPACVNSWASGYSKSSFDDVQLYQTTPATWMFLAFISSCITRITKLETLADIINNPAFSADLFRVLLSFEKKDEKYQRITFPIVPTNPMTTYLVYLRTKYGIDTSSKSFKLHYAYLLIWFISLHSIKKVFPMSLFIGLYDKHPGAKPLPSDVIELISANTVNDPRRVLNTAVLMLAKMDWEYMMTKIDEKDFAIVGSHYIEHLHMNLCSAVILSPLDKPPGKLDMLSVCGMPCTGRYCVFHDPRRCKQQSCDAQILVGENVCWRHNPEIYSAVNAVHDMVSRSIGTKQVAAESASSALYSALSTAEAMVHSTTAEAPKTAVANSAAETPKTAATNSAAETPKPAATNSAKAIRATAATNSAAETPKTAATNSAAETPKPAANSAKAIRAPAANSEAETPKIAEPEIIPVSSSKKRIKTDSDTDTDPESVDAINAASVPAYLSDAYEKIMSLQTSKRTIAKPGAYSAMIKGSLIEDPLKKRIPCVAIVDNRDGKIPSYVDHKGKSGQICGGYTIGKFGPYCQFHGPRRCKHYGCSAPIKPYDVSCPNHK